MCRVYQEYPYDTRPEPEDFPLNFQDQLLLKLGLPVGIGKFKLEGWKRPIPWYLFECKKHGLVTNYKCGFSQKLICPKCFKEEHSPIGAGEASRSSEEVSIVGDAMRAHSVSLPDPSEDKEASP